MRMSLAGCTVIAAAGLAACSNDRARPAGSASPAAQSEATGGAIPDDPQALFMAAIERLCGKAFAGRLASTDAVDADFADRDLVMHVRECTEAGVRIPFHVGDDRSRTWVVTRTGEGLRLKHDHRHEDGSEDAVTQYGGDTRTVGTPQRQAFPVDDFSVALFLANGLTASVTNVWAMDVTPETFAYELRREGRFFRIEFDLTAPVDNPPPPWGAK